MSSRDMFLATFRRSSGLEGSSAAAIRTMVDQVLKELSPEFHKMYSRVGRPYDYRRSSCYALCCCRCCTRCAASGSGGRDRLQHIVPLVRGAELGRCGVGARRS